MSPTLNKKMYKDDVVQCARADVLEMLSLKMIWYKLEIMLSLTIVHALNRTPGERS